jgi:hypothetical protein
MEPGTAVFTALPADARIYRIVVSLELGYTYAVKAGRAKKASTEASGLPSHSYAAAKFESVTPVALGLLWAVLENKRWSARRHLLTLEPQLPYDDPSLPKFVRSMYRDMFALHSLANGGRPLRGDSSLYFFPAEFVDLLAGLEKESLTVVSKQWLGRLWRRPDAHWPPAYTERVLRAVVSRAKKVTQGGPQLYLWMPA